MQPYASLKIKGSKSSISNAGPPAQEQAKTENAFHEAKIENAYHEAKTENAYHENAYKDNLNC